MKRLALFEISSISCSIPLDKVLRVLTEPQLFKLPLLRDCFAGGLIFQEQFVPVLSCENTNSQNLEKRLQPIYVLVCEAEFGLVGIPADKIVKITKIGEIGSEVIPEADSQYDTCKIDGCDYHLLDLNLIVEDPDFTLCGMKD